MTVRVKICGLTRLEDALAAVRLGADALGFNFWPGSKRFIAPAEARAIIRKLPPLVTCVEKTNEPALRGTPWRSPCGVSISPAGIVPPVWLHA